jgi:hypothetical protein
MDGEGRGGGVSDGQESLSGMFFSEEKNQKTFNPAQAAKSVHGLPTGSCGELKVFCFFSSEKKILP